MPARWGQNFLADAAWRQRVAAAVAPQSGEALLEIGGGNGDLSALLAAGGCRLTIVEIDPLLAARLGERFASQNAVQVRHGDILALDWSQLAAPPGPWRLFGNLPYYITGPILFRYFRQVELFRDATVMVQKEIADRLTAVPGPEFGRLSAAAQFFCRPHRMFDLPPGAFRPQPKVWSSLVKLEPAEMLPAPAERQAFLSFLRVAFAQKRKRLGNNLKTIYSASTVAAALADAHLDANARAEQCTVETLWRLFQRVQSARSTLE